jgi:magnesium-transporting ATPase (P-type)
MCYIETKSLDGETNLKLRNAMRHTLGAIRTEADLANLRGEIIMEHPNKLIESFTGTLDAGSLGKEPIQPQNVLLRGCSLRNTEYVMGIVINTGHDTKIMMGSTETPSKASGLERRSSEEIRRIVALLLLVCTIGATGMTIWNDTYISDMTYLDWDPTVRAYACELMKAKRNAVR